MYHLTFELDGLPKSPNALLGAHWTIRAGHAKNWKRKVWRAVWHLKPKAPLEKARLTFWRFSSGRMDDDNLALSFKSVRDALKECAIIVDDSPAHVQTVYVHEKVAPGKGRIKVAVEELTE